ncbi:MAG TPA: TIGR01459 family HAD-type hydrolase [Sphingomicrobium sp.]|nr:TIGR01459 family HAD-type hydrolase [Sphingomicrobium sp.]
MSLDSIECDYRVILCDIWGCIHDGVKLYPGACRRLERWRGDGRTIILITNAPRTAQVVAGQLVRLGLDPSLWDGIATSGEAGIACLEKAPRPVGFIGTAADRAVLEGRGVRIAEGEDFDELACAGLDETRPKVADYDEQIRALAERKVVMHCLNPDRVVIRGGQAEPCAGAIAERYLELGGPVEWYGKPYPAIYEHAMHLAGHPPKQSVLAIGDALHTDMLGAARMGFDCVFVAGGIHRDEPFPEDFGPAHGLGDWQPVAIVDSLA